MNSKLRFCTNSKKWRSNPIMSSQQFLLEETAPNLKSSHQNSVQSCQTPIISQDIHYYCKNPDCPAQLKEKLLYFVSRDALDIAGFGDSIIQLLIEQNLLNSFADFLYP